MSPDNTIGWIGNGAVLASRIDKVTGKPKGGFFNLGQLSLAMMAITAGKVEMQDTISGSLGGCYWPILLKKSAMVATAEK
ncbi:hypothetical protein [Pseudomonas khorasanensis]|uniref:hypothetical protein n=1 Tax=Pseudomonas khorasanensis TaxID=2745508 RepID=UPI001CED674C|nr:hypothetical protein [Pseudomonas khorasanensis]